MSTRVISKRHIHIPQLNILPRLIQFVKNNVVMVVALTAAAVTAVIVPPDREYLHYFDLKPYRAFTACWRCGYAYRLACEPYHLS